MTNYTYAIAVKKHFKLRANIKDNKNIQIKCPYHDDKVPSASINLAKGVFQCFKSTCVGGKSLRQLCTDLKIKVEEKEKALTESTILPKYSYKKLRQLANQYIKSRGFNSKLPINWDIISEYNHPEDKDKIHPFYGYLAFESINGAIVGRNILPQETKSTDRPKYKNLTGPKEIFILAQDKTSRVIWIVEGIFDGLSLAEVGIKNIIVNRGSRASAVNLSELCYSLRKNTVVILYDNDPDGYIGAKELSISLREYEVDYDICELPLKYKDANEFFVQDRRLFSQFIRSKEEKYYHSDEMYIERFIEEEKPLTIIKTGLVKIDHLLTGGYKEGYHIISGPTECGKTSIITYIGVRAALEDNLNVLINSCELPKRQMWSRVASIFDKSPWSKLEEKPKLMLPTTKNNLKNLSFKLRIVFNWPLEKILVEADRYNLIIIDYIQRMGEIYGGDLNASRFLIDKITSRLSSLAELGIVSIVVSSLDRASYNNPRAFGLKESGGLEYAAASVSRITKISEDSLIWDIQKNTRGSIKGQVKISNIDLGHCKFK